MDPLLLVALALFTAFTLGRASARSTWRRVAEARADLAAFEAIAQRWRQHDAPPVADWPTVLPAGDGVRELTTRAVSGAGPVRLEEDTGPRQWPAAGHGRGGRWRHRRYTWVGFWSASITPRDPQARLATAMQRADGVPPLREAEQVFAELTAPACAATAAQVLAATWSRSRDLVGVA